MDINVAIPLKDSENNITAEEFQTMLSSWFEEKGIISDLRSQLRFKMINVLKNTAIGRNISRRTTMSHHSLSKQAINLIVAEFLMQTKCHFSLSVFNTEAALTNIFPEYPGFDSTKEPFRFNYENLSSIFELVGIHKNSEFAKEAREFYCNNADSILSCLISTMCKFTNKMKKKSVHEEINCLDFEKESNFVKQLARILGNTEISSENIVQVLKNIEYTHHNEVKMMEEKYIKSIEELKNVISSNEEKLQEVYKSKGVSDNKLIRLVGEYNAMKIQMKNLIKEKLQNERKDRFRHLEKNDEIIEVQSKHVSNQITQTFIPEQCSNKCEKNMKLVDDLQEKNQELCRKNETLSEELYHVSKKYNEQLEKVLPLCSNQHCSTTCERNRNLVDELREKNKELCLKIGIQSEELFHLLRKYNEQTVTPVCSSQHCSDKCDKNINIVDELKEQNWELAKKSERQSEEIQHLLEKFNEHIMQRVTPVCSNQHCSIECIKNMNLVDELREKTRELSRKSERDQEELYCLLRKYKEQLIQKVTPVCSNYHCGNKCERNIKLLDELQAKNQDLSRKSQMQSEELFHLSKRYKDLLHDYLDSQRKISYLNAKAGTNENHSRLILNQTVMEEGLKTPEASLVNNIDSDSSTSVTEEILREARLRLQILEEESNKIEKKFKHSQVDSSPDL